MPQCITTKTLQQKPVDFSLNKIWPLVNFHFLCAFSALFPTSFHYLGWNTVTLCNRVKITAVAQMKVGICWPFHIVPVTCCLYQQSTGPLLSPASSMLLNLSRQWVSFALLSWYKHVILSIPGHSPSCPHSHSVTKFFQHSWDHWLPIPSQNFDPGWNNRSLSLVVPVDPSRFCLGSGTLLLPGGKEVNPSGPIIFTVKLKNWLIKYLISAAYLYTGEYGISPSYWKRIRSSKRQLSETWTKTFYVQGIVLAP